MATPPSDVRGALTVVTAAGAAEIAGIGAQAGPQAVEVLLEAVPGIVSYYLDGSAALAMDWYEELRSEASVSRPFDLAPVVPLNIALIRDQIEKTVREVEKELASELDATVQRETVARVAQFAEREIAGGFRETVVENSKRDPESVGWRRFARPGACKLCRMLAARGAIYSASTARFAAHGAVTNGKKTGGDCKCVAGPAFRGEPVTYEASAMQYVASRQTRTEKQRATLRAYLNENYPDSPG